MTITNAINSLSAQPWVERLGWTLLHFMWQGVLIAAVYALARTRIGARVRYSLALTTLLAMLAAPIVTFVARDKQTAVSLSNPASFGGFFQSEASVPAHAVPQKPFRSLPTTPSLPWRDQVIAGVVTIWFAGASILWLRLLGGWMVASRMRSMLVRPAPREWQQKLDLLRERIRVSTPVRLLVSTLVEVPTVIGWLRPVVLVPIGALTGLPAEHIEALLAHELAHIRRFDNLVNILQRAAEAMLFYHPAVWWVSNELRNERELCCDDIAATLHGDRVSYACALASLESRRSAAFVPVMAANGGALRSRIARLLGQSLPATNEASGSGAVAATILALVAACGLWSQTADMRPQFEVASIKPNHSGTGVDRIKIGGGSVIIENVSLQRIIGMAHGVPEGRNYLFSGPDWLESENFDISAKYPAGMPDAQVMQMLQRQIEERFQLRLHREMRDFSAFALVLAKDGPKFHLSATQGGAYRFSMRDGHAVGTSISMGMFADRLSRPDFYLGRQVVDMTGLTGTYDLTFDFKPETSAQVYVDSAQIPVAIFTALPEQLGLKLEARKIPLEVLVVDHANRTPTEN